MLDLFKNARLKYFLLLFNLFIFILLMYTWDRPGYLVNITFWSVPRTKDTQRAFFQKIWTFGLGQTFWPEIFLGIWGIFGRTISTHFGIVSSLDLFMFFGTIFLDVILGWYYDILGWKIIMIFNWEKKTVFDQ